MASVLDLSPLREGQLRRLVLAQLTSTAGDFMVLAALPFAVFSIGGSVGQVGIALAAQAVVLASLLIVGGIVGDRLPRRSVVVGADLLRFASQGVVAVLLISGGAEFWQLLCAQAALGAGTAFFMPAMNGLVAQAVPARAASAGQRAAGHDEFERGSDRTGARGGGPRCVWARLGVRRRRPELPHQCGTAGEAPSIRTGASRSRAFGDVRSDRGMDRVPPQNMGLGGRGGVRAAEHVRLRAVLRLWPDGGDGVARRSRRLGGNPRRDGLRRAGGRARSTLLEDRLARSWPQRWRWGCGRRRFSCWRSWRRSAWSRRAPPRPGSRWRCSERYGRRLCRLASQPTCARASAPMTCSARSDCSCGVPARRIGAGRGRCRARSDRGSGDHCGGDLHRRCGPERSGAQACRRQRQARRRRRRRGRRSAT